MKMPGRLFGTIACCVVTGVWRLTSRARTVTYIFRGVLSSNERFSVLKIDEYGKFSVVVLTVYEIDTSEHVDRTDNVKKTDRIDKIHKIDGPDRLSSVNGIRYNDNNVRN